MFRGLGAFMPRGFAGPGGQGIPAAVVAPSVLFEELEIERIGGPQQAPILNGTSVLPPGTAVTLTVAPCRARHVGHGCYTGFHHGRGADYDEPGAGAAAEAGR